GLTEANAAAGVAGLAKLPDMHALMLSDLTADSLALFASAGAFPSLGKLYLRRSPGRGDGAVALAGAAMPRLAVLELVGCGLRNDGVTALARSELAARLRVLSLENNEIGDRGVATLSASPAS